MSSPLRSTPAKVAAAITGAALFFGTGSALANAGGQDAKTHARAAADQDRANLTGGGNAVCRVGFDTQTTTNIPPDDSTADNAAAATVTMTRPCAGPVVGVFTSEVSTPTSADFIHIDFRATCIGTGGLSNPCAVGQQTFAGPGHTFFKNGAQAFGVSGIQMVWSGLKKGQYRFEVLPGGNNVANLQFRSFVVTAYAPGG